MPITATNAKADQLLELMAKQQTTYFHFLKLKARKAKLDKEHAEMLKLLQSLEQARVQLDKEVNG